jgi:hypothetical protein
LILDPRTLFAVQRRKSPRAEARKSGRFEHKEEETFDETTSLLRS